MNTMADHLTSTNPGIRQHLFPQIWFLLVSVCAFGLYVAWDQKLLHLVFALDRSYITSVITTLVLVASCHAAWHIFLFSQRIEIAALWLSGAQTIEDATDTDEYLHNYLADLRMIGFSENSNTARAGQDTTDAIIDIYSDHVRSRVELGWFLVDLAVRLGLLGTIIGFILIFTSLSSSSIEGSDGLKELLVSMSGGMGTALFTTLGGLVGATFISFQYLILGREAEHLVSMLVRVRARLQLMTNH